MYIVVNQRVGTFCEKCRGIVCVCKYINQDKIMESFITNAKQSKQIYTVEDMKSFADWCRNGLLNTEYSVDRLEEHLQQWKQKSYEKRFNKM